MKIELKGPKALVALLLIVAFFAGRFFLQQSTLEAAAAEALKLRLQGEYAAGQLHGVETDDLSGAELESLAGELLQLEDISFTSVSARGVGSEVYVRVEIAVAGKEPPDGKAVRYYKMTHGLATGWRVRRETTALAYYLKLF